MESKSESCFSEYSYDNKSKYEISKELEKRLNKIEKRIK